MGLDDVRPFNFRQRASIPIFASEETICAIRRCFEYIFNGEEQQSSVPHIETHTLNGGSFELFGQQFAPIRLLHGRSAIYGFRFGRAAYLTDHSEIPAESMNQLSGLDVLFLDALRHKPHPTHSTVRRSIETVRRLAPHRAFFTHICHDLPHEQTERALPPPIRLAYDGLEIVVEDPD
jgi:phosphoribosyl 1,2-cyclic phosphate phosphodiesterase